MASSWPLFFGYRGPGHHFFSPPWMGRVPGAAPLVARQPRVGESAAAIGPPGTAQPEPLRGEAPVASVGGQGHRP